MPLQMRAATLTNYEEVARSVGLNPFEMLKRAGLSLRVLSEKDLRIPANAVGKLLELSATTSGVENFGLRMAQSRRLSVLGTLGMAMRDAPNLNEVFRTAINFMQTHNESIVMHVTETAGFTTLQTHLLGARGTGVRQGMELSLGALLQIMRMYLGDNWVPVRVCFTHGKPKDIALHRQIFGPKIDFNAEFNGVICKSEDLRMPTPWADPVMAAYSKKLLQSTSVDDVNTTLREVKQLILVLLPSGSCSIEQVARQLRVDRRTVHRKLQHTGVSFTGVLKEIRADLSDTYLSQPKRSLAEIANMLGFSDSSAYSRWHKQMRGETLVTRRARLLQGSA